MNIPVKSDLADGQWLLAINGGHHRASARAYRGGTDSVIELPKHDECINLHSLKDEDAQTRLDSYLRTIADRLGYDDAESMSKQIAHAVFAFPGAGMAKEQEDAELVIRGRFLPHGSLRVVDDTWAGLFAEALSPHGICAFAGAGASVCFANTRFVADKSHKIDGWGPIIGDFGSGFHLVTKFFRRLGRKLGTQTEFPLFSVVDAFCRQHVSIEPIDGPDAVQQWFDGLLKQNPVEWRSLFSELATPIVEVVENPTQYRDLAVKEARLLLASCAMSMARSIKIALGRMPQTDTTFPVVLQGGMFRHSAFYRQEVIRLLGLEEGRVISAIRPPVDGALFLTNDGTYSKYLSQMPRHIV